MNPIPWYQSKVYIGAVVTILSTLASLAPKAATLLGLTSPDAISTTVESVFSVIALVAGIFTAQSRQTSSVQPLTLTQASADKKSDAVVIPPKQGGRAHVGYLAVLCVIAGCGLLPTTSTAPPATALQTFDQLYSAGVQADDLVVVTATNVLKAGLITSDQAQKVQDITVQVKSVLDAAQVAFNAGNSLVANANLTSATTTVVGLSLCLTIKPLTVATFESCIQPILTPAVTS